MSSQSEPETPTFLNDVFISYSRIDREFAACLEKALRLYRPPKGLGLPQRNLVVFRDEEDFTGGEYHASLEKHLKGSRKMIIICSPNARQSQYVNEEIRRFAKDRGNDHIIPVIVSGIPNNEARSDGEEGRAFPEALCEVMEMPLAASYIGFVPKKDKVNKGVYYGAWYRILADLYDISRNEIEERDKKRKARRRTIFGVVATGLFLIISTLAVMAWLAKLEAEQRMREAQARKLAAQAELARGMDFLPRSSLLAIESLRLLSNAEASLTLHQAKALLPHNHILFRHDGPVRAVAIADKGKTLLSAGEDGVVRLWDLTQNRTVRDIPITKGITVASFSPDGTALVASGRDKVLRIWSLAEAREIAQTRYQTDRPLLSFSPDGRYLAVLAEQGVQEWDLRSAQSVTCANHISQKDRIRALAISRNGTHVATGSRAEIQVTRDMCQKVLVSKGGEGGDVMSMAFDPDGQYLAVGREFQTVQIFSLEEGVITSSQGHKGAIVSVAYDSSGALVASASTERNVMIWDAASGHLDPVSVIPRGSQSDIINSFDTSRTEAGPSSGAISVWDARISGIPGMNPSTGREVSRLILGRPITSVSQYGRNVVTGSEDSTVRVWNTGEEERGYALGWDAAKMVVAGSQGKYLVLVDRNGRRCAIFAIKASGNTIEPKHEWESPQSVAGVVLSPDERYLAVLGEKGVEVIEASSRRTQSTISTRSPVITAAFMQGGERVVTVEASGEVSYWETASGNAMPNGFPLGLIPASASISGDGKRLLVGSVAGLQVWDLEARRAAVRIAPGVAIAHARLSENGRRAVVLTSDHRTHIWDAVKGGEPTAPSLGKLEVDYEFAPVAMTRDAKYLAGVRQDGIVLVWDMENQQGFSALPLQQPGPIAFTHDGKYLITVEPQINEPMGISKIKYWLWHPDDLILDACSRLTVSLSESELQQYLGEKQDHETCQNEAGRNNGKSPP